jgi:cell division protein FtsA
MSVAILDLGSSKVACLAADVADSGGFQVLGAAVAPCRGIRKGLVTDVDATSSAIAEVIREVEKQSGRTAEELYVTVGGAAAEGFTGQGIVPIHPRSRAITREDVLHVINHSRQAPVAPDREVIQAMPREFVVDGVGGVRTPIGMSGERLEVSTFIITAETSQLENIERAVQMAGKRVGHVILGGLASGLGVLTDQELETGAAVVDIGAGKTDFAAFAGGSLVYSCSIPIGGALVTSDLSNLLRTNPEVAEHLKVEHGCAIAGAVPDADHVEVMQLGQVQARPMQRKVFCEIIESRMKELAVHVRQQIDKNGLKDSIPAGLVLTGGGSSLPETVKLFETHVPGVKARVGTPKTKLSGVSGNPAGLSAVLGLARFAFDTADDDLSPASGGADWKAKVKTLWSLFDRKA